MIGVTRGRELKWYFILYIIDPVSCQQTLQASARTTAHQASKDQGLTLLLLLYRHKSLGMRPLFCLPVRQRNHHQGTARQYDLDRPDATRPAAEMRLADTCSSNPTPKTPRAFWRVIGPSRAGWLDLEKR